MTFEEWYNDNFLYGKSKDYKLDEIDIVIRENCKQAWNAAKEDSRTLTIEWSERAGEYLLRKANGCLVDYFQTEEEARLWAYNYAYKIKEKE